MKIIRIFNVLWEDNANTIEFTFEFTAYKRDTTIREMK